MQRLTRDPYGQGSDPIILAYNHVITGEPEIEGNAFTNMDVYTPENVKRVFSRLRAAQF